MDPNQSTSELTKLRKFTLRFLQHPVKEVKEVPHFKIQTSILFQFLCASLSGSLAGLVGQSWINIILGALIFPVATVMVSLVATAFLYYFFLLFLHKKIYFKQAYTMVVFTSLPMLIFHVASPFVPPIDLVGYIVTGLLLIIGLVENFSVPKKRTSQLIFGIFVVLVILWVIQMIYKKG